MILFAHPGFLLLLDSILKILALALAAGFFLVLEIVVGAVLLAVFRRRRLLYWALPLVNCSTYLWLLPKIMLIGKKDVNFADQFSLPQVNYTILAFLCLIPLGLISAKIVLVFASLFSRLSASDNEKSNQEARPWRKYLARLPTDSRREAFREGLLAPKFGLSYLLDHPRLWRYAIYPIILNILITTVAFVFFFGATIGLITYLHPFYPVGWAWILLEILCGIALVVAAMAATLVLWILMQGIFCGIYYEKLARQMEIQLGTPSESLKSLPFREQVTDTLGNLGTLIAFNAGLLFLNLIPVFGSVGSIVGGMYYDCLFVGREYLDYPLALRGRSRREKQTFVRMFRYQTLGLGAAAFFTNLIPVVGIIIPVTAVAGGVMLHRRLIEHHLSASQSKNA